MIHVIADIRVYPGRMDDLLAVYRSFVPQVRAEQGCLAYVPTRDLATDLANQHRDADRITVVECWADMIAFRTHLTAPHVLAYRQRVKDIVADVTVRVLDAVPAGQDAITPPAVNPASEKKPPRMRDQPYGRAIE